MRQQWDGNASPLSLNPSESLRERFDLQSRMSSNQTAGEEVMPCETSRTGSSTRTNLHVG